MLKIGDNCYGIVQMNSRLSVQLYPPGESVFGRQQVWEIDAHFAPDDCVYKPRPDGELEYLELWLRAENYQVSDWRQLSNFGLDDAEADDPMILASLRNRLVTHHLEPEELPITLDEISHCNTEQLDGSLDDYYLFDLELAGFHQPAHGPKKKFTVNTIVMFKEVIAYVPLNSADPVKTAQTMAAKLIKLDKFAGSRVTPYDPTRATSLTSHLNSHHIVTLQTLWP